MSRKEYIDRVQAAWTAQISACLMGFQFEHKVASVEWIDSYQHKVESALVDDDWYYEICALRAFEKYGTKLTVRQLGEQWKENACGSWGSSEQARMNLANGIQAPHCGHPRYNKLWFTIGPQFSSEIYGLIAPGMPNVAGRLAREFSHVNGFAEGSDGAVFMAGMVSLAFIEDNPRAIIKAAAHLIHPSSPYRQMLDEIISMAEAGKSAREIFDYIEDRWHMEYPATNNAVPNGGIVAIALWFGQSDFLKTINLVYSAADFTDADCNAANAGAVIAVIHGSGCIPKNLVEPLHDRIVGGEMGRVKLTPPVDEKISDLAQRTAKIGEQFIRVNRGTVAGEKITITTEKPRTQQAELFTLGDLMQYWNPAWKLERAGFGGAGGGIGNIRGITHLEGDVLATWPRDPVRGVLMRRQVQATDKSVLTFDAAADPGRAWELEVYANNKRVFKRLIDGTFGHDADRLWNHVKVDLSNFQGKSVELRLYQRVLLADKLPGNAYWRNLQISK